MQHLWMLHDVVVMHQGCTRACALVRFSTPNMSQHVATEWLPTICCVYMLRWFSRGLQTLGQQCWDMLCWNRVAIVWPGSTFLPFYILNRNEKKNKIYQFIRLSAILEHKFVSYMAYSVSSQDEPRVRCCDWLPASTQDGVILPARDYALRPAHLCIVFIIPRLKSFIYQPCSVMTTGYYLCFFFFLVCLHVVPL